MNKVLAVLIAGFFAVGAYAQPKPPEVDATGKGKAVDRAEMKKDAKPAGQVKLPVGDTDKAAEAVGATPITKKAADRRATRDERRPDKKTGEKRAVPVQGGTPQ